MNSSRFLFVVNCAVILCILICHTWAHDCHLSPSPDSEPARLTSVQHYYYGSGHPCVEKYLCADCGATFPNNNSANCYDCRPVNVSSGATFASSSWSLCESCNFDYYYGYVNCQGCQPTQLSPDGTNSTGCDFEGQCCQGCRDDPTCLACYDYSETACYTFHSNTKGYKPCTCNSYNQCWENMGNELNLTGYSIGDSKRDCKKKCKQNPSCAVYSYKNTEEKCFLYGVTQNSEPAYEDKFCVPTNCP